jgi:hypothetical protein
MIIPQLASFVCFVNFAGTAEVCEQILSLSNKRVNSAKMGERRQIIVSSSYHHYALSNASTIAYVEDTFSSLAEGELDKLLGNIIEDPPEFPTST